MKVYEMERGNGKTTKCILELVTNKNAIMIVPTYPIKRHVISEYQGVKNIENRVCTIHELLEEKVDTHTKNYFVFDELDWILEEVTRRKVKFATLTP